jgi:hypothetical protein
MQVHGTNLDGKRGREGGAMRGVNKSSFSYISVLCFVLFTMMSKQLEGLLDSSLYAYADHPELITVKRRDLEVCMRATISNVILEGGNIACLVRDCMDALDKLAQSSNAECCDIGGRQYSLFGA